MKLSTLVGAPAGSAVFRDNRCWHGGTPNLSDHVRAMPNIEYFAPWFRSEGIHRCMPYELWQGLSDHGKRICRYVTCAPGETVVIEKEATRDHTERMLTGFGATLAIETGPEGRVIRLQGQPELSPREVNVPRDPSSAAFPVCAALVTEGSDVLVPNIGLNPTRAGLFETLIEMGADLTLENPREEAGEPVADLRARFSPAMTGVEVPPERAASMID